jgi:hypothetical protein
MNGSIMTAARIGGRWERRGRCEGRGGLDRLSLI